MLKVILRFLRKAISREKKRNDSWSATCAMLRVLGFDQKKKSKQQQAGKKQTNMTTPKSFSTLQYTLIHIFMVKQDSKDERNDKIWPLRIYDAINRGHLYDCSAPAVLMRSYQRAYRTRLLLLYLHLITKEVWFCLRKETKKQGG